MKRFNLLFSFAFVCLSFSLFAQTPTDLPPNAEPGKCYAKCIIPDEYETVTEQVLVKAASQRVETVPAAYETVTEQVMVKPESKRMIPVPAEYETVTEQVMVKPESKRLIPVPAEYETVTEQVMVKAESKRLIPVPAEYETVTEQYVVKEASTRIERVPAKYTTESERIEVRPASTKWVKRKADRNCLSADPNDCLVWCLVEVPAEYRTVTKQVRVGCESGWTDNGDDCVRTVEVPEEFGNRTKRVIKTPASSREEVIPAEYTTITKRVVKTPATTREEIIPAEYKTVTKRVVKTPATVREEVIPAEYNTVTMRKLKTAAATNAIEIPAEYATITKTRLVKKGGFTEWREVLCNDAVTQYTVRQIQEALRSRGYDPGPIDDIMGVLTKKALTKYQKDQGLPVGQLDFETLKSLGIRY